MTDPQPQFLEVGQGEARRRIFYRTEEVYPVEGPGIVWLGGLKSEMTATKASALADWARGAKRSFSRFDYSGHGVSDRAFQDCTIGDWLEDTLAILQHICSGPQILVGSSMGGWLTLLAMRQLMSEKPDLPYSVSGAVLIAPAWKKYNVSPNLPADAVILHSADDDIVPLKDSFGLPAQLYVCGADHRMNDDGALYNLETALRV